MLVVRIFKLDKGDKPTEQGRFIYEPGKNIRIVPGAKNKSALQFMLSQPIEPFLEDKKGGSKPTAFFPDKDPVGWMKNLNKEYASWNGLWASEAVES